MNISRCLGGSMLRPYGRLTRRPAAPRVPLGPPQDIRLLQRFCELVHHRVIATLSHVMPSLLQLYRTTTAQGTPLPRPPFVCYRPSRDVKRSTPTQQPTIPWSSLLRQRPRQCSTLQLTQQGWGDYQELSCSLSLPHRRRGDP